MYYYGRIIGVVVFAILLAACENNLTSSDPSSTSVFDDAVVAAKTGPSCNAVVPGDFGTIQAAVDAASAGDVICVETGVYQEQVVINKDLSLSGRDNPTILAPGTPDTYTIEESSSNWQPVVFAYGGTEDGSGNVSGEGLVTVSVNGFTIDGNDRNPSGRAAGVLLRNVSSKNSIAENIIQNMHVGGNETFGIIVYGNSDVAITGNHVSGFERGGIGANGTGTGNPAPNAVIEDNRVIGSPGGGWAPNGIQIGYTASGSVMGNTVSDNRWTGANNWNATGILIFESDDVQISDNHLENNDAAVGVAAWGWFAPSADNVDVKKNTIADSNIGVKVESYAFPPYSTMAASVSNAKIVNNDITDGGDVGVGIFTYDGSDDFDPIAHNNKVVNNFIDGYATAIEDEGTATKDVSNSPSAP